MFKPKLFIHIPKNAGLTVRRSDVLRGKIFLASPNVHQSKEYTKAVLKTMNANNDHHGFEHARWRDCSKAVTLYHDAFAIVRNPWDRVVSRYFFAKKVIEVEKKEPVGKHHIDSFEDFLEERFEWGGKPYMWHRAIRGWYPAFDHVSDERGNLRCDIMRFENLNEDLCKYFKIPTMSRARNVTGINKGSYKDMYTPKTIQIIADWYQKDIEFWGFDFDSGPTKNYWNQK